MTRKDSHMDTINIHIKKFGFHLCFASGGATPRCVHSVGLLENFGFELVFPGGIFFLKDQVQFLFKKVIEYLKMNNGEPPFNFFNKSLGEFTLKKAHDSWTTYLLKSAVTYHKRSDFTVLQIVPGEEHFTKDTPDLSLPFNTTREPIWKWLKDEWSYNFPKNTNVVTNLDALQGYYITEIMRWEQFEWEIFSGSGPDTPKDKIRVVPMTVLTSIDPSVKVALTLKIGKGVWRDFERQEWIPWG